MANGVVFQDRFYCIQNRMEDIVCIEQTVQWYTIDIYSWGMEGWFYTTDKAEIGRLYNRY